MSDADLKRILARMDRIPKAVRAAMQPALDKSAAELVRTQKSLAPHEDGDLQNSIEQVPGDHDLQRRVVAGGQLTTRDTERGPYDYAKGQELGTKNMPANPFFYPAARLLRKRIRGRLKRAGSKAIREIWGKP